MLITQTKKMFMNIHNYYGKDLCIDGIECINLYEYVSMYKYFFNISCNNSIVYDDIYLRDEIKEINNAFLLLFSFMFIMVFMRI